MKVTGILIALAPLALATQAAAQRPARPQAAAPRPPAMSQTRATGQAGTQRPATAQESKSFTGIAGKLNTTPDAMETAYQTALQANPKLRRGQFVAANVLAQNLGEKHSGITTQAILDGLKAGKSIGQTLQGLGLTPAEAQTAQRSADREISAAAKR